MQTDTVDPTTFSLRPEHKHKFRPNDIRPVVRSIIELRLENEEYKADEIQSISKEIADTVRDRIRGMDLERYKIMVHCMIGEQRGQGVRAGCKMFWDSDTDDYFEEVYVNQHLFAVVTVFGLYQY
ncbi:putative dynein light chain [Trypanosoma rangeli]|uniref:Putative dynein light chain n=1 Tax=Trypanosoma rangeli TaxID=5698 RepID=A0A422P2R8_TRYRA|nr:putative dynein light chain [Trypanosoma rangeli]RNF12020.1 putative dynein light chain [Trypanosoma rangeli]|eukprot:RNF12020.1 putative dynein light chain [Trypanosoma rangeli]